MAYNGRMHSDELARLLGEVPGIRVTAEADLVTAHVPAIGDTVRVTPGDVLAAELVVVPDGSLGAQLDLRRGHEQWPVIVTGDDVVFMPADPADLVRADGLPWQVPSMPHLVAYSEMHRDVRALGRAVDDPDVELDPEILGPTLLLHRCFLAGAVQVGLWPVRVAAWWEYTWARTGTDLPLPAFQPDESWNALMDDVSEARRRTTAPAAQRTPAPAAPERHDEGASPEPNVR
jgi:hypothetical protein